VFPTQKTTRKISERGRNGGGGELKTGPNQSSEDKTGTPDGKGKARDGKRDGVESRGGLNLVYHEKGRTHRNGGPPSRGVERVQISIPYGCHQEEKELYIA